jgi:hypothetical protein
MYSVEILVLEPLAEIAMGNGRVHGKNWIDTFSDSWQRANGSISANLGCSVPPPFLGSAPRLPPPSSSISLFLPSLPLLPSSLSSFFLSFSLPLRSSLLRSSSRCPRAPAVREFLRSSFLRSLKSLSVQRLQGMFFLAPGRFCLSSWCCPGLRGFVAFDESALWLTGQVLSIQGNCLF